MLFDYFSNRIVTPRELTLTIDQKKDINDILGLICQTLNEPHSFNHHKIRFIITGYTNSQEDGIDSRITKLNPIQIDCIKNCLMDSDWNVLIEDKKFAHEFIIELSHDGSSNQTKIFKLSKTNGVH